MELLYTLPALILALIGLIGLRKENESLEILKTEIIKESKIDAKFIIDLQKELKLVKKSNASNQGWNTKYRKTIEELEERIEAMVLDREWSVERMKDQADTIKRLINKKWK